MAAAAGTEPEYYSAALIGSSGGGTATLGHTDPVELLTTIHRELLRVRDRNIVRKEDDDNGQRRRRRRVCIGISHAIFVSLCDGSGFDAVRKNDWLSDDDRGDGGGDAGGPVAALYVIGFNERDASDDDDDDTVSTRKISPFCVTLVDRGPLIKINKLARDFDVRLSRIISKCHPALAPNRHHASSADGNPAIAAIISLSSEPTVLHSASLCACNQLEDFDTPIAGSGGTSLSQIASLYDLRIVGNSGGSVASTTLTKARGWAMGLAGEWDMVYDANFDPVMLDSSRRAVGGDMARSSDLQRQTASVPGKTPIPALKSILEAALPSFLFVCIALNLINAWENQDPTGDACLWNQGSESTPINIMRYALQHIVLGTVLCILAASSRNSVSSSSSSNNPSGDQSTLLMAATIAGVLASASSSQSVYTSFSTTNGVQESYGGGSALAGLVAGAAIPIVLAKVSHLCYSYHVTATMTNILCGGGVGMLVGVFMHVTGISHSLGLTTGLIRSLLRWRRIILPGTYSKSVSMALPTGMPSLLPNGLMQWIFPMIHHLQELWVRMASFPSFFMLVCKSPLAQGINCTPLQNLPIPLGIGFLFGCVSVYGSKIGYYHSIFLPLILLEMDAAPRYEEASLLGAIDECTLAMVCAGICAGNLILPLSRSKGRKTTGRSAHYNSGGGHASLSWQALKTNFLCGDFIEAAYPSMEQSVMINGSAFLAAGLSTEILVQRRVLSTAYLPLPVAIWISNDGWGMGVACLVAFVVSLFGTLTSNAIGKCSGHHRI